MWFDVEDLYLDETEDELEEYYNLKSEQELEELQKEKENSLDF